MPLEVPNTSAAELDELERQVDFIEAGDVTKAKVATVEQAQAAMTAIEANRQKAAIAKVESLGTAIDQAFTPEGITTDLTQVAAYDAAVALYGKAAAKLRAVHVADAICDHAAATVREAECLLAYEKARRAAQEERLLEDFSRVRTGGVEFTTDTALLLSGWSENIRRAEVILQDAQTHLRNAEASRLQQRAQFAQQYPTEE